MRLTSSSKNKIRAIVIGTIIVLVLLAVMTTRGCVGDMTMDEKMQRFDTAGFENISIDFPAGKLKVHEATGNENDVVIYERVSGNMANKGETTFAIENDTLIIGYRTNPLGWLPIYWFGYGQRELDIALPSEIYSKLNTFELHGSAGECEVDDLQCSSASVTVSAGNVSLDNFIVEDNTELELSAGSLTIKSSDLAECKIKVSAGKAKLDADMRNLDVSVSAGQADIACANSNIENIDIDLSAGGVELQLPKDVGFDAAVDKSAGSFDCGFEALVRGETYKYGDGRTPINIHISAGSMKLKPLGTTGTGTTGT